jgi:hypothetical protein
MYIYTIPETMPTFSELKTPKLLDGFKEVKPTKYASIPIGVYVRYFKDGELRYGGFLKVMSHPDYMVLYNNRKKVSWSVQLKDPSLHVWIRDYRTDSTYQEPVKKPKKEPAKIPKKTK